MIDIVQFIMIDIVELYNDLYRWIYNDLHISTMVEF